MCGIYLTNKDLSKEGFEKNLESIHFRGPDYTGIVEINGILFGHLRLSILDLDERSHQPMTLDGYTLIFNGEIYNYIDIREELIELGWDFDTSGDTEVLLKGFIEWGKDLVPKMNGMFAFTIYDAKSNKIFCSRDRLGVKPFYYYWKDGMLEICSQLRPISKGKEINEDAISIYLDCTYIPSPFTIYKDVYKLAPGKNLEIDLNTKELHIEEYWNIDEVIPSDLSYDAAKEQMHELLKDAVKIRLQSDVPFGCFLSGGIDSALVSSIAAKISKKKIRTFSIGFDDPKFDESEAAAKYAEIIGSNHTETICTPSEILEMLPKLINTYDEPFADSSALPSLLLNKVTKNYVTMALSGDGGDESFLGYNHFDWVAKFKKMMKVPFFLRYLISYFVVFNIFGQRTKGVKKILRTKTEEELIAGIFVGYNSIVKNRDLSWLSHFSEFKSFSSNAFQSTADLNIKLWLENDSNVKVDRASMAFSVEVRSPFLDYRVIELARRFPVSYRYVPNRKKRMLRDILSQYIPEKVFDQPKKGFSIPIGDWIRNELKDEFIANLSDDFLQRVPNLNVPKFKKMLDSHLSGKGDYSSYIWRVYVLSKWYQEFGFYKKVDL